MQETLIQPLVWEKIPNAMEELSPCTTTIEAVLPSLGAVTNERVPPPGKPHALEPVPVARKSHHNKQPMHHNQRVAYATNEDPAQPKIHKLIWIMFKKVRKTFFTKSHNYVHT